MKKILILLFFAFTLVIAWCWDSKKEDCHHDVKMWNGATVTDTVFFKYENWNCYIWVFERWYTYEENDRFLILNRDVVKHYEGAYDFWENAIDKYKLKEFETLWNKDNFK